MTWMGASRAFSESEVGEIRRDHNISSDGSGDDVVIEFAAVPYKFYVEVFRIRQGFCEALGIRGGVFQDKADSEVVDVERDAEAVEKEEEKRQDNADEDRAGIAEDLDEFFDDQRL